MAKNKKNIKPEVKKSVVKDITEPSGPKSPEELRRRNLALASLGIVLLLFAFIWIEPGTKDLEDPWYTGIRLFDSSRKVADEAQKVKLLEEGGTLLKSLAAKHPYHARVHHYLGIYYAFKREWDSAIAEQTKAIDIGSGGLVNNVEFDAHRELLGALFNKGNGFSEKNQLDSAITYYSIAVEKSTKVRTTNKTAELIGMVNNNLSIAYMQKGNELLNNGSLDSALEQYEKSVAVNPRRADALNNIGTIYSKKGDQAKAMEYFSKALSVDPENKNAADNMKAIQSKAVNRKE